MISFRYKKPRTTLCIQEVRVFLLHENCDTA
nr:MAG TPA: hypothetical protein [Caudoviricetes sp.]